MSSSSTLVNNTSGSSAATSSQRKNNKKATTTVKKAPWRVPGYFEPPDIIKEAWEKRKNQITQQPPKQPKQPKPIKRWIPVGKTPSILPLPPLFHKIKQKLHAAFDSKFRKTLPRTKIMESNPKDQFEGLTQVGSGANGAVVQAIKKNNKTHVAIKRCFIEDEDTPHHAYILRELRIMGCLNHPNLIQLKEACLYQDHLWMCMELMSCSVFNLLYNTTTGLCEGNTVRIAKECLEGIVYLHSKNYMHRDIKCENILLNRNGQVKLADFGLAAPLSKVNTARLGTAKWMAPEVVSEDPYKENVDIWSLAITMIEMMDRVPPLYYLENIQDIYTEILYSDPPSFHFSLPSNDMASLVAWMLNHNGATRPHAKAVLKRINNDIKKGTLQCTEQEELGHLVTQVFPNSLA